MVRARTVEAPNGMCKRTSPLSGECEHRDKVAVIDCISFVNPKDEDKSGRREIDRLLPFDMRVTAWEKMAKQRCLLEAYPFRSFQSCQLDDTFMTASNGSIRSSSPSTASDE